MSSIIMDFFHNLSLNSGGGGVNPSEFKDELTWYNHLGDHSLYKSTTESQMSISETISKPIILRRNIGYYDTQYGWMCNGERLGNLVMGICPYNYPNDYIPSNVWSFGLSTMIYLVHIGLLDIFITTLKDFKIKEYKTLSDEKISLYAIAELTNGGVKDTYSASASSYLAYQSHVLPKLWDDLGTSVAFDSNTMIQLYIYIDPANRLVQIYHTDYNNPDYLLHSMILPKWICPEEGIKIYHQVLTGWGSGATPLSNTALIYDTSKESGNVIIPDGNFNPNVNVDNTDIYIGLNKWE